MVRDWLVFTRYSALAISMSRYCVIIILQGWLVEPKFGVDLSLPGGSAFVYEVGVRVDTKIVLYGSRSPEGCESLVSVGVGIADEPHQPRS
jgi:hypothetical protein